MFGMNTGRIRLWKILKVSAVLFIVVVVSVVGVEIVVCGTFSFAFKIVGFCSIANVTAETCAHFELATAFFYDITNILMLSKLF